VTVELHISHNHQPMHNGRYLSVSSYSICEVSNTLQCSDAVGWHSACK